MSTYVIKTSNSLMHHGIKGMHWGVRRFQNSDGSLTAEGKLRYGSGSSGSNGYRINLTPEQKAKAVKTIKIGAVAVGTALAVIGGYKLASSGQLAKAVRMGKSVLKTEAASWKGLVKESGKQAYKGFKEGLPEGARGAGKAFGKTLFGGITWMAGIEIADLMTDGAVTQQILKAYNDHQKKENRVRTSYKNKKEDDD